jgi:hypothetical protein
MLLFVEEVPKVTFMVAGVCTLGILLGYPAAHWIGKKLGDYLSFLPTDRFARPQPALGIPKAKAMRGDLEGAAAAYEELLLIHPQEKEIHFRLLEVALGGLRREDYAERVLRRGLENLKLAGDRDALVKLGDSIRHGEYHPFHHLEPETPPEVKILPPLFQRAEQ